MSWAPREGEERRKDDRRTHVRARALRRNETPSEQRLWKLLRLFNRNEGASFRRQAALGAFVFDFADFGARLLIELDGVIHELRDDVALRDARKEGWAQSQGFRLLRIRNADVWSNPDGVADVVRSHFTASQRTAPHPLPPPHKGEGE